MYGFRYKVTVHRGARDTLYYRMRQRLEGVGMLHRMERTLSIEFSGPLVAPDPRLRPPAEHGLLALVAQLGALSPREAADQLQIPVRTAQHVLKALAEEGFCRVVREGRALRYEVQDTTFSPPTQH